MTAASLYHHGMVSPCSSARAAPLQPPSVHGFARRRPCSCLVCLYGFLCVVVMSVRERVCVYYVNISAQTRALCPIIQNSAVLTRTWVASSRARARSAPGWDCRPTTGRP